MPFILLLFGALLAIAAYNDSAGTLATELETDIPAFMKWGIAVFAVGAIGWIPGAQTISRWLVALVMVVLFLSQWQNIFAGFSNFAQNFGSGASGSVSQAAVTPAAAYAANPNNPQITQAEISGTGSSSAQVAANVNANAQSTLLAGLPYGQFDPANFVAGGITGLEMGFGGLV